MALKGVKDAGGLSYVRENALWGVFLACIHVCIRGVQAERASPKPSPVGTEVEGERWKLVQASEWKFIFNRNERSQGSTARVRLKVKAASERE